MIKRRSIVHEEARQAAEKPGKEPYLKPELKELGNVVELTRGAIQAAATDDGRILHS